MKTVGILLLAACVLGGCKSKSTQAPEPLAPFLAGVWKPVAKNATCTNGGFRFGSKVITVMRKGHPIEVLDVEKTIVRGRSLELTLKLSDTVKLLNFPQRQKHELDDIARIFVSLNSSDHRIEMNDIQIERTSRGLTALQRGQREQARQIFTMERCTA